MAIILNKKSLLTGLLITLFWLLFPDVSYASDISFNPLDNILSNFNDAIIKSIHFQQTLETFAENLFFGLIVISFLWRFFPMVLKEATMEDFVGEIVKYIITTGFFLWLVRNGFHIGTSIIQSLEKLAGLSVGQESVTPSSVLYIGFTAFSKICDVITPWNVLTHSTDILLYTLFSVVFLILCTLVAITLMLAFIKSYFVIYAGMIVLGFGSATWSQEMVVNYFKACINYGVRIFTLIVVVSVCTNVLNNYISSLRGIDIGTLAELLVLGLVFYMMSNKLPEVISGMVGASFSSHSNAGHMISTVSAPVQTVAKMGAGAATGGAGTAAMMAAEKLADGAQGSISGSAPTSMPPPPPPPTP